MNFKGLFVGLTTIDIQYLVDSYPESNTKTKSNQFGITTGGPATNAAITFSFLGGQSDLWSAIGKNQFTNFIKKEFRDFKVNLTDINPDSELNPTISAIVTSK